MIGWLMSTKTGRFVSAVIALGLSAYGFYWFAHSAGEKAAGSKQKDKSLDNLRERESNDQKIDSLPDADLDARFARWVRPE